MNKTPSSSTLEILHKFQIVCFFIAHIAQCTLHVRDPAFVETWLAGKPRCAHS